jgi:hypothetical protein
MSSFSCVGADDDLCVVLFRHPHLPTIYNELLLMTRSFHPYSLSVLKTRFLKGAPSRLCGASCLYHQSRFYCHISEAAPVERPGAKNLVNQRNRSRLCGTDDFLTALNPLNARKSNLDDILNSTSIFNFKHINTSKTSRCRSEISSRLHKYTTFWHK